jgi:hypothetical protein
VEGEVVVGMVAVATRARKWDVAVVVEEKEKEKEKEEGDVRSYHVSLSRSYQLPRIQDFLPHLKLSSHGQSSWIQSEKPKLLQQGRLACLYSLNGPVPTSPLLWSVLTL